MATAARRGESRFAAEEMQRAAPANGEAAPQGEANEGGDPEGALANQQQDEETEAANGNAPLEGSANEGERRFSSANEDAEAQEVTNDSKELQLTNEERECKAPTIEDRGNKVSTNEDKGHRTPTNEDADHKSPIKDTATPATNKNRVPQTPTNQDAAPRAAANENSPRQPPANQATPPDNPTNDVTALPTSTNSTQDTWDWSLEEAWLRAPDEEWWAAPEGWGAELGEDEDERGEEWRLRPDEAWAEEGLEKWLRPNEALSETRADQWQPSPDQAWCKLIIQPGFGLARPGFGSLCRVLLAVPSSPPPTWGLLSPAANAGRWVTVRLGSAEGRWANMVDAVLETMTSGELALLRPVGVTVATVAIQLGRFTLPPPFWETPPTLRWRSVTSGQARAAALLTSGMVSAAGMVYSRSIRAAILAGGPPPYSPDIMAVKAELHAGLASVQLRLGLPAAAAANAGKALALHPAHLEARYRRGVAQAAMMDLEAAMADLMAVLRVQPGHAGARRELQRVRGAARERDARLARRLGRLFA